MVLLLLIGPLFLTNTLCSNHACRELLKYFEGSANKQNQGHNMIKFQLSKFFIAATKDRF